MILGGLAAVVGLGMVVALRQLEPRLHDWVTSTLSRSLESEIELGHVRLSWFPLQLTARDLTVRHHGRTDIPPLLVVSSFTVDLRPGDLWSSTVDHVKVDGMEIHIPPKDQATGTRPLPRPGKNDGNKDNSGDPVVVRRLTATNTRLAIVPRTAGKNAKVWDVFKLEMDNLSSTSASPSAPRSRIQFPTEGLNQTEASDRGRRRNRAAHRSRANTRLPQTWEPSTGSRGS
jgi:hypothetical protein